MIGLRFCLVFFFLRQRRRFRLRSIDRSDITIILVQLRKKLLVGAGETKELRRKEMKMVKAAEHGDRASELSHAAPPAHAHAHESGRLLSAKFLGFV